VLTPPFERSVPQGVDLRTVAKKRTVKLTTRGRKTGQPRTVKIWFVVADSCRILVQHASPAPAHWYANLLRTRAVTVDFGDGPLAAEARPIADPERVKDVLRRIRRKYLLAWVFQLMGRKSQAVAAEIVVGEAKPAV